MADFAPSVAMAQQPSRWGLTALLAGGAVVLAGIACARQGSRRS